MKRTWAWWIGTILLAFLFGFYWSPARASEPSLKWPVPGRNELRLDIYGPWRTWGDVADWEIWQGATMLAGPGAENGSSQDAAGDIYLKAWMRSIPVSPDSLAIEATINGIYMCLGCPLEPPRLPIEPFVVGLAEAGEFATSMGDSGLYFPAYNSKIWPASNGIFVWVPFWALDQLALARGDSMYIFPDPCLVWGAALGFPVPEEGTNE